MAVFWTVLHQLKLQIIRQIFYDLDKLQLHRF